MDDHTTISTFQLFKMFPDNYLTEFEKDQLEYEGRITYPAKELVVV